MRSLMLFILFSYCLAFLVGRMSNTLHQGRLDAGAYVNTGSQPTISIPIFLPFFSDNKISMFSFVHSSNRIKVNLYNLSWNGVTRMDDMMRHVGAKRLSTGHALFNIRTEIVNKQQGKSSIIIYNISFQHYF